MTMTEIDALARLLDGDPATDGATDEGRALAALAQALEARAAVARPEFRDELRARLVAEARQAQVAAPLLSRVRDGVGRVTERWRYSARVAAASASAAVALSTGGMAVAAERSLPGDLLFGVKTAFENVTLNLADGEEARASVLLARADDRVTAAFTLAEAGDDANAAVALRQADESSRAGAQQLLRAFQRDGDVALLDRLDRFTAAQSARLDDLEPLVAALPGEASGALADYRVVLGRINSRIALFRGDECPQCELEPSDRDGVDPRVEVDLDSVDLSVIPPASEPFNPCPCGTPRRRVFPAPAMGPRPDATEPRMLPPNRPSTDGEPTPPPDDRPDEPPQEPPPGGPLPGVDLPSDPGDVIRDLLKPPPAPEPPPGTPPVPEPPAPPVDALGAETSLPTNPLPSMPEQLGL